MSLRLFAEQLMTVYKDEGVKGFYKGLIPSLILVSNPAVQFMVYERLKPVLMRRLGRKRLVWTRKKALGLDREEEKKVLIKFASYSHSQSATDAFLLGAIAKLVATFVTFPYLLVKSRLQVIIFPSHSKLLQAI